MNEMNVFSYLLKWLRRLIEIYQQIQKLQFEFVIKE